MTEPAGCISLAQEALRKTLGDSDTLRSWVGAADRAAAMEHIFHEGLPEPDGKADAYEQQELVALRPFVIVWTAETEGLVKDLEAGGDKFYFGDGGQLLLRFEQNASGNQPASVANLTFKNSLGRIMDELGALAGLSNNGDYLACKRIVLAEGPFWTPAGEVEAQGIWQAAILRVSW